MIRRGKFHKVDEFERMRDALRSTTSGHQADAGPEVVPLEDVRPMGLVKLSRGVELKPWT